MNRWPDIYFTAEANEDPFDDVTIITLRSDYLDRLFEEAIRDGKTTSTSKVSRRIKKLADAKDPQYAVQERVEFKSDGKITVVANIDVIDETTMWKAVDLVRDAIDRLDTALPRPQTVTFSLPMTFGYLELAPLMTCAP